MQSFIRIVWVGAEIAHSLYRMCVFVISYILTRGKGAPPPPREDLCGAQSPDHPVEAPVKITRWRSLVMPFWNLNKFASVFFQHSNDFCNCIFYILKFSLWNLHRSGWDIDDGACERFGPVVSPCRFANLRNNGAGQLTYWLPRNFSSFLDQIKY